MATIIIRVKPYFCPTLKTSKTINSNTTSDQQIQLMHGHKIPSADEIKDRYIANGITNIITTLPSVLEFR
ncbi:hypothetical protein GmHk_01G001055 [Glycine max]|nr:hypothetical protein GmHk_01G001055 [Glycine max]